MRVTSEFVDIPAEVRPMRAFVARPKGVATAPGLLFYSDIFQLTPSTLRMATRFAGYGFAVVAPEIYHRVEAPGEAWAFDDAGRDRGLAAARATPVAAFDEDIKSALAFVARDEGIAGGRLGAVGFCTGGHLAFRAAFAPEIKAAVCYYPTGLHDGVLGRDPDARSLERASDIRGKLQLVFGLSDPHVGPQERTQIERALTSAGVNFSCEYFDGEHAFMRDEGPRYDPELTDAAFAAGIATLRSALA